MFDVLPPPLDAERDKGERPTFAPYNPMPWMKEYRVFGLGAETADDPAAVEAFFDSRPDLRPDFSFAVVGAHGIGLDAAEALKRGKYGANLKFYLDDFLLPEIYERYMNAEDQTKSFCQQYIRLGELSTGASLDYVVCLGDPDQARTLVRMAGSRFAARAHLVIPGAQGSVAAAAAIENPRPICVTLFPTAGSNLLRPMMTFLMGLLKRPRMHSQFFAGTDSITSTLWRRGEGLSESNHWTTPTQTFLDRAAYWHFRNTNLYTWNQLHHPVTTAVFADLTDMAILHLVRDPRDVVTSHYMRSFGTIHDTLSEEEVTARQARYLEGFVAKAKSYEFTLWPPIRKMAQDFVDADRYPHMRSVRYEDLRQRPVETLTELLEWLHLAPNPFVNLPRSRIEEIVSRTSFEHITGGQRRENEDNTWVAYVHGRQTSLRRGAVGDWRTYLTRDTQRRIKEQASDLIIELGYESTGDW